MASSLNPEVSPFGADTAPLGPRASRRKARRARKRRDNRVVFGVAVAAAVLGGLSAAAPTGLRAADVVWCAALAAGAVWAGSRSRRWAWLWSAGVVAVFSISSWWVLLAVAALVLALVGAFFKARFRPLGALIGGLVGVAALHVPAQGFHGLPSLVAAAALVPLFASGYDRSSAKVTRRIRGGALVVALLALLAAAACGVAAVLARSSMDRAVHESKTGLAEIRAGQQSQAAVTLDQASDQFDHASDLLGATWTWPARLVPVLAQQRQALVRASSAGAAIARAGSVAADTAPYQELKASDGRVDLPTVLRMQQPVANTATALRSALDTLHQVNSGWLVGPVASPIDDFTRDVSNALPQAELASEALDVAPAMLGANGDRTYLILFTNPAESRFLGGFTGSFGILTAHQGKVSFTVGDRISNLFPGPAGDKLSIQGEPEFLARYGGYNPARNLQNLTVSPDLPTDATVVRSLFHQYYGSWVDGVLVVDPYALAALLQLTGPVAVPGLPYPLTADNAARYLVYQQYVDYGNAKDDRKDILSAAGKATFKALTTRSLPGPADVGAALGPMVQQGRLLFYPFDASELPLFQRMGTVGGFDPDPSSDYLSLRSANANPNKIDSFLTRSVDYQVSYNPGNGMVDATATIVLHNQAPARGLPEYLIGNSKDPSNGGTVPAGTNTMYVSYYSPLVVSSASIDGRPAGVDYQTEKGSQVYSTTMSVGPGQSSTLVLHLEGTVPSGTTYRLQVLNQPMVNADTLSVAVRSASPAWHLFTGDGLSVEGSTATFTGGVTENRTLSVDFHH
jgi:hypothetical protein